MITVCVLNRMQVQGRIIEFVKNEIARIYIGVFEDRLMRQSIFDNHRSWANQFVLFAIIYTSKLLSIVFVNGNKVKRFLNT